MKTIDRIIKPVNGKHGAPMGRRNEGVKPTNKRIYDCYVPMCSCCGAYDRGGAYWGAASYLHKVGRMRVAYTKDLTYIEFYRGQAI